MPRCYAPSSRQDQLPRMLQSPCRSRCLMRQAVLFKRGRSGQHPDGELLGRELAAAVIDPDGEGEGAAVVWDRRGRRLPPRPWRPRTGPPQGPRWRHVCCPLSSLPWPDAAIRLPSTDTAAPATQLRSSPARPQPPRATRPALTPPAPAQPPPGRHPPLRGEPQAGDHDSPGRVASVSCSPREQGDNPPPPQCSASGGERHTMALALEVPAHPANRAGPHRWISRTFAPQGHISSYKPGPAGGLRPGNDTTVTEGEGASLTRRSRSGRRTPCRWG
jgi:hypothetical protein